LRRGDASCSARHQLIASAGLALDQHRGVRRRYALEHREHLADCEAVADQLAEPPCLARWQVERLRLGLDAQRRAADQKGRPRRHGDLSDPRARVPRAVGRLQIAHDEPRPVGAHCDVSRRHPIVGERKLRPGAGTDDDLGLAEHDELTAQPAAAAIEDVAVHCRGPCHAP
jgi:hypothetical protein